MDSNLLPDQPEAIEQQAPAQGPPATRLQKAYAYLKEQEVKVPDSYDEFEQGVLDKPERIRQLYDYFKSAEVQVPDDFGQFEAGMLEGVKKKAQPAPSGNAAGTSASAALPAGDKDFAQVAPDTTQPVPDVAMDAEAEGLRGDTIPVPRQGQLEVPGDEYVAAGLPLPSGEQLRAEQEARDKAKADAQDDGFWASLGKSLYNGLDPKRIGGNLTDYFGDAMEMLGRSPNIAAGAGGAIPREVAVPDPSTPLREDKATDVLAKDWLAAAERGDLPLSDAAKQGLSQPSLASAGALLGSGVASIVPVALASAVGGPGAGAAVGGALGVSATKDAARQAGVSDKEATVTATVLAPIQAALEAVGVKDPGVAKLAVRATVREALAAGGGKLSAQALATAAKQVLPELGRRAAAGAGQEALTEFLQGEVEGGGQLLADKLRGNEDAAPGQGRYGVTPFDALVKSPLEQALVGGVLGGGLGTTHGVHPAEASTTTGQAPESGQPVYVTGDATESHEGALDGARVLGPGSSPNTVLVEGKTFAGETVQREVEKTRVVSQQVLDSLPDEDVSLGQPTSQVNEPAAAPINEQQPAIPSEQLELAAQPNAPAEPSAEARNQGAPTVRGEEEPSNAPGEGVLSGEPALADPAGLEAQSPALASEGVLPAPLLAGAGDSDGVAPEGERKSMNRLLADESQPEAVKDFVRDSSLDKYEPKSLDDARQKVTEYLDRVSLDEAVAEATGEGKHLAGDVRTVLRTSVLHKLNEAMNAAVESGDTVAADKHLDQVKQVVKALAERGTDAGQEINAYKDLVRLSPEGAVYQTQKDVAAQREQAESKLAKQVPKAAKAVRKEKAAAVEAAVVSKAVRAAKEKVTGQASKPTTKEQLADLQAERAQMFAELKKLTTNLGITPQQQREAELHVAIFKNYIKTGILKVRELVERFQRDAPAQAARIGQPTLIKRATAALGDHQEAVRQGVQQLGTTLDRIARDYVTDASVTGKTLAERFVEDAGLDPKAAQQYAAAVEAEFSKQIDRARQKRLDELNKRAAATPAKRASQTDLQKTRELFTLSPTDDAAILDHLKRVNDLPNLDVQQVAELRKLAQKVQAAPEGFQKDEAVEKLQQAQQRIKGLSLLEVSQATWYANLLSGPKTHGINLIANTLQAGSELGVATAHGVLTGKGRYALAPAKGLARGLARSVREVGSVLATGREVSKTPDKFEVPSILEQFKGREALRRFNPTNPRSYLGLLETVPASLKYVNRALRAGDILFSTGLKEMRAHELAAKEALEERPNDTSEKIWARVNEKLYRTKERIAEAEAKAKAEGLTGNDYKRRVWEIAEQSRDAKMMDEARQYGTAAVFNGELKGSFGVTASALQGFTEKLAFGNVKPAKYVLPFVRIISNIATAYLDYTPVGLARAAKGSHLGGKEGSSFQRQFTSEERGKLVIKSILGAATAASIYALTGHENDEEPKLEITGGGTGDPTKDRQLRADGWQPYSLRQPGGTWVSYANTPVGIMLVTVGNLRDQEKYANRSLADDESLLTDASASLFKSMQFVKDMTAVRGAADFLAAVDSRNTNQIGEYLKRLAAGSAKGYVPWAGLLTQVAKSNEDYKKDARSFSQLLYQDIPVARDGLNNALDVLGDPLPVDTDRIFSSAPHRDEQTQQIWGWLSKNNLFIPVPARSSGGAMVVRLREGVEGPMTDSEYYRFMQKRGQMLKAALLTNMSDMKGQSPREAKEYLRRLIANVNPAAKMEAFNSNELTDADRADLDERRAKQEARRAEMETE